MSNAHEVVAAYWAAAEAREWRRFGDLLNEDVVYEGPQTRERVRGRNAYVRFNTDGFPGDWHLTVMRIVAEDRHAASWIEFTGEDQEPQPGLCFFELDGDGLIVRISDFWPDPYDPASAWLEAVGRRLALGADSYAALAKLGWLECGRSVVIQPSFFRCCLGESTADHATVHA